MIWPKCFLNWRTSDNVCVRFVKSLTFERKFANDGGNIHVFRIIMTSKYMQNHGFYWECTPTWSWQEWISLATIFHRHVSNLLRCIKTIFVFFLFFILHFLQVCLSLYKHVVWRVWCVLILLSFGVLVLGFSSNFFFKWSKIGAGGRPVFNFKDEMSFLKIFEFVLSYSDEFFEKRQWFTKCFTNVNDLQSLQNALRCIKSQRLYDALCDLKIKERSVYHYRI